MSDPFLFENKFLSIRKCKDRDYFYAERLGVNSIAFILYRSDNNYDEYGVIREFKPPVNDFIVTAFGGSLDKDKSLIGIVIEETKEEAGYTVNESHITYCGKRFVSTQMNQFCHLFMVNVTGLVEGEKEPETYLESIAEVVWLPFKDICTEDFLDWKAQVIIHSPKSLGL